MIYSFMGASDYEPRSKASAAPANGHAASASDPAAAEAPAKAAPDPRLSAELDRLRRENQSLKHGSDERFDSHIRSTTIVTPAMQVSEEILGSKVAPVKDHYAPAVAKTLTQQFANQIISTVESDMRAMQQYDILVEKARSHRTKASIDAARDFYRGRLALAARRDIIKFRSEVLPSAANGAVQNAQTAAAATAQRREEAAGKTGVAPTAASVSPVTATEKQLPAQKPGESARDFNHRVLMEAPVS
jgi:hypothetical protein